MYFTFAPPEVNERVESAKNQNKNKDFLLFRILIHGFLEKSKCLNCQMKKIIFGM